MNSRLNQHLHINIGPRTIRLQEWDRPTYWQWCLQTCWPKTSSLRGGGRPRSYA